MQVKEVMTQGVELIGPDATLREAAAKMKQLDVGSLPVAENDRLIGMITDRDTTIRAVAQGLDPNRARVREAMTPKITYVFDDQDVSEAADIMKEKQIRRLPVLNRAKRLVGIVSLGDLAVESGDEELCGETLEAISEPSEPNR
jgi:CBS domain-containing protein